MTQLERTHSYTSQSKRGIPYRFEHAPNLAIAPLMNFHADPAGVALAIQDAQSRRCRAPALTVQENTMFQLP